MTWEFEDRMAYVCNSPWHYTVFCHLVQSKFSLRLRIIFTKWKDIRIVRAHLGEDWLYLGRRVTYLLSNCGQGDLHFSY